MNKNTEKNKGELVFSTDGGKMCPTCRRAVSRCVCKRKIIPSAAGSVVRVSRESKGRGGKVVTVVRGLALAPDALMQLGKRLKASCGAGGTVKDGVIEVQGDHCDRVIDSLGKEGYVVKRAGG